MIYARALTLLESPRCSTDEQRIIENRRRIDELRSIDELQKSGVKSKSMFRDVTVIDGRMWSFWRSFERLRASIPHRTTVQRHTLYIRSRNRAQTLLVIE